MSIRIEEGEVKKVRKEEEILYPGINSCLAITVCLADGTKIGGHAVMFPEEGQFKLKDMLEEMRSESVGVGISRFLVLGDIGTWKDNFESLKELHGYGGEVESLKGCFIGEFGQDPAIWEDLIAEGPATYDVTITAEGDYSSAKH